ncbi:MAG: SOS response-associated peptidase [Gammaproteobacteria bacterium]|jgi:putative SOS response-associated peptidase YedK|nr:SOS response-associated peptidase [Gammaproteobacteria bacterium]
MCGRYAFYSPAEAVIRLFDTSLTTPIEARYNIAPTQFVPVIRESTRASRQLVMLYWGLVPAWAKEKAIGNRMINARSETLAEKPSFRRAFSQRRCLVLASGFYEWRREDQGKRPYFISRLDGEPFAMAGLWESWSKGGDVLDSCTIVTTAANEFMRPLHHRMPAILPPALCGPWLDVTGVDTREAEKLLQSLEGGELQAWPVSTRVNNPANQGPGLVEPEGTIGSPGLA